MKVEIFLDHVVLLCFRDFFCEALVYMVWPDFLNEKNVTSCDYLLLLHPRPISSFCWINHSYFSLLFAWAYIDHFDFFPSYLMKGSPESFWQLLSSIFASIIYQSDAKNWGESITQTGNRPTLMIVFYLNHQEKNKSLTRKIFFYSRTTMNSCCYAFLLNFLF